MIQVGEAAPHFTLMAMDGQPRDLRALLSECKALVLVFYLFDFSGA